MVSKKEYPVTQSNNVCSFWSSHLTKYQLELQCSGNSSVTAGHNKQCFTIMKVSVTCTTQQYQSEAQNC